LGYTFVADSVVLTSGTLRIWTRRCRLRWERKCHHFRYQSKVYATSYVHCE